MLGLKARVLALSDETLYPLKSNFNLSHRILMNSSPQVSVIMLTHNSQAYLQKAIDSVYAQSFQSIEMIIVDTNSTDTTLDILDHNFQKSHFHFYRIKDTSPEAALNFALKQSQGNFLCFLEPDEQWAPHCIEKKLEILEGNPEIDLIFNEVTRLDHPDSKGYAFLARHQFLEAFQAAIHSKQDSTYFFNDKYFDCAIKHTPFIWTSSIMIRKAIAKKTGYFDEELVGAQEIDYWMRIAKHGSIAYLNLPLTIWHHYHKATSHVTSEKSHFSTLACYQKIKDHLGPKQYLKSSVNQRLALCAFAGGYEAINDKALNRARYFFMKACYYRPNSLKYWLYAMLSFIPVSLFLKLRRFKMNYL